MIILVANGQSWDAIDDWDEDTLPDRRFPADEEVEDELLALFTRKAA